mmetsp:Transcript_24318/g.61673  ORF Transcript_24318/g.61673 Transcript_24318/m.61673 type:complete len:221 (-) Transcript_24318:1296-1958(-)
MELAFRPTSPFTSETSWMRSSRSLLMDFCKAASIRPPKGFKASMATSARTFTSEGLTASVFSLPPSCVCEGLSSRCTCSGARIAETCGNFRQRSSTFCFMWSCSRSQLRRALCRLTRSFSSISSTRCTRCACSSVSERRPSTSASSSMGGGGEEPRRLASLFAVFPRRDGDDGLPSFSFSPPRLRPRLKKLMALRTSRGILSSMHSMMHRNLSMSSKRLT